MCDVAHHLWVRAPVVLVKESEHIAFKLLTVSLNKPTRFIAALNVHLAADDGKSTQDCRGFQSPFTPAFLPQLVKPVRTASREHVVKFN